MKKWKRIALWLFLMGLALFVTAYFTRLLPIFGLSFMPFGYSMVLSGAEESTLYSLEPKEDRKGYAVTSPDHLHGFKILGSCHLDSSETAAASEALSKAVRDYPSGLQSIMCFEPRQALRVTSGGKTYDFVICYTCEHLYVFVDGSEPDQLQARGSSEVLDGLLEKHGVTLSKTGPKSRTMPSSESSETLDR